MKNLKIYNRIVTLAFKIDIIKVPLFFQIVYLLVPKIEICLKHCLDKNAKKQPSSHYYALAALSVEQHKSKRNHAELPDYITP